MGRTNVGVERDTGGGAEDDGEPACCPSVDRVEEGENHCVEWEEGWPFTGVSVSVVPLDRQTRFFSVGVGGWRKSCLW